MEKLFARIKSLENEMVQMRRDFHKHPESAWTEFRTASKVAERLTELGYEVYAGDDALVAEEMMGVPEPAELEKLQQRAIAEGANPVWVKKMTGGKTGVLAVMKFAKPGKTVAFRVDMDANDVQETHDEDHLPNQQGFASIHTNVMHACGHDMHTTMGLTLAKVISEHKDDFAGTIKIVFQCAEEGVRGAKAMAAKGVVDDADYFFGIHVGSRKKTNSSITCMVGEMLATSKIDAYFQGLSAHAGAAPQDGKNALLAAAQACVSLHTIARHGKGASRINVGVLNAGTGRNVLPDVATIKFETRGVNSEINAYMEKEAYRMVEAAAAMYDVKVTFKAMGSAPSCIPDVAFGNELYNLFKETGEFVELVHSGALGGSEDCTYFMDRVQARGGKAIYMFVGGNPKAGVHNSKFDIGEDIMLSGVTALTALAKKYSNISG